MLEPFRGKHFDLVGEILADPLELETVGRGETQLRLLLIVGEQNQWTDPRADLLGGKFLLKPNDAGLPELVHVTR